MGAGGGWKLHPRSRERRVPALGNDRRTGTAQEALTRGNPLNMRATPGSPNLHADFAKQEQLQGRKGKNVELLPYPLLGSFVCVPGLAFVFALRMFG